MVLLKKRFSITFNKTINEKLGNCQIFSINQGSNVSLNAYAFCRNIANLSVTSFVLHFKIFIPDSHVSVPKKYERRVL